MKGVNAESISNKDVVAQGQKSAPGNPVWQVLPNLKIQN
jgi:hypothetical protein